jgi:hypothetical protein
MEALVTLSDDKPRARMEGVAVGFTCFGRINSRREGHLRAKGVPNDLHRHIELCFGSLHSR